MIEVTCAIVMDGNKVLVTQRSEHMPHPLKWEFPGGKLKEGETPERCIIREIREELGVEIEVRQLLPSVRHIYGKDSIKLIPFICRIKSGEIALAEHRSFLWADCADLDQVDFLEADVEVVAQLKRHC
jgi:8-oxo-dGTP diphosphatase